MKKLLIIVSLLWAVVLTTVAQDNFKLTGKIDGADSDTLCIEYIILQPEKQIVKRKVAVEKEAPERKPILLKGANSPTLQQVLFLGWHKVNVQFST